MSRDYFSDELSPELIALLPPILPTSSLNALAQTCRRLQGILQPELEARLTPELAKETLRWAAAGKPHIVTKLLAPPYRIHPTDAYEQWSETPLHIAARAGNKETVALLLDAGANPLAQLDYEETQPLHLAVESGSIETVQLLLDRGAPINTNYGCEGWSSYALHTACDEGNAELVAFLLNRGANMELRGHNGTALGFALRRRHVEIMRMLLKHGAEAEAKISLNPGWLCGGPPPPHSASMLYFTMALKHPKGEYSPRTVPIEGRKEIMSLLLAHGASKNEAMKTIDLYLEQLADAAEKTQNEFLEYVKAIFKEAEDAMPEVVTSRQVLAYKVKEGIRKGRRSLLFRARPVSGKSRASGTGTQTADAGTQTEGQVNTPSLTFA